MNYKPFVYSGVFCIVYALFLKYETRDWVQTNSIVRNVKVNDTVLTEVNGLEISEIESNADVIYKIDNEIYTNNVSVVQNQPLQLGNVIPIKYDNNLIKRKEKGIPSTQYWYTLGATLLVIGLITWKKYPSEEY